MTFLKTAGQPAAMPGAVGGEPIAREGVRSNVREQAGAKTLRGLPRPAPQQCGMWVGTGESRLILWGAGEWVALLLRRW
jgi:hypothetical protein